MKLFYLQVICQIIIIIITLVPSFQLKINQKDQNELQKFRLEKMKELQEKKIFTSSVKENFSQKYDPKLSYDTLSKAGRDEFVNFLGFLGDTSKNLAKKIEKESINNY